MSRIAASAESTLKADPQELARLLQDLKSGVELSADQHVTLEKLLDVAAQREPAMVAQVAFKQEIYSGPLPHHDQLNAYDEETRRQIVAMAVRDPGAAAIIGTLDLLGMVCAFVAPRALETLAERKAVTEVPAKKQRPSRKK
jgi:hypothetical protein